jgi:hypothetical protein
LSELGLFLALPDLAQVHEGAIEYVPDPPLYSDGLHKLRHVFVPPGQQIDNADRDAWQYPPGTWFAKTFLDDGESGPTPVETRFIRVLGPFNYEYAVYQWNAEGSEATLAENPGNQRVPVEVTVAGESFTHQIPSTFDCEECHLENGKVATDIIGFDELRLNSTLDGSLQTQLERFAELGLFSSPLPAELRRIDDVDPALLEIKRFVYGNCVHCHNGRSLADFRPDVFVANTVGVAVNASGVAPPEGMLRVVPGDPESSVVFLQVRAQGLPDTLRPMPPVGVQFPPADVLGELQTWITSLGP